MPRLRKDIPVITLSLLSAERSQQFYVELPVLEHCPDNSQDHASANTQPASEGVSRMNTSPIIECPTSESQPTTAKSPPESVMSLIRLWLSYPAPYFHQSALFDKAGITSGSKQSAIKKSALAHGLIIEHKLQRGKGWLSVWEPCDLAYETTGIAKAKQKGKGGYLHRFVAHYVKKRAVQGGYSVDIEVFLPGGKAVDLVLRKDSEVIFVEIAITPPLSKEIHNIRADFATDLIPDKLIMAVRDGKMRKKVEGLITSDPGFDKYRDKLEVVLAGSFVK